MKISYQNIARVRVQQNCLSPLLQLITENTGSGSNKRELTFVACSLGARHCTKRLTHIVSLKPHSSPGRIPSVSALGDP